MTKRGHIITPKALRHARAGSLSIPKGITVAGGNLLETFEERDGSGATSRLYIEPGAAPARAAMLSEVGKRFYHAMTSSDRWYVDVAVLLEQAGTLEEIQRHALALLPPFVAEAYEQNDEARALVSHLAQALPIEWRQPAHAWLMHLLAETAGAYALEWQFQEKRREQFLDELIKGTAANVLSDIQTGNYRFPPGSPRTLEGRWALAYRTLARCHLTLLRDIYAPDLAKDAAAAAIYPGAIRGIWTAMVAHFEATYPPQQPRRRSRKPTTEQPTAQPAARLPAIPTATDGHFVTHALNPVAHAIGRAVADGSAQRDWHDYRGTTVPHHVTTTKTGGEIRVSKRDETGELEVSDAVRERLFDQLRSYGALERNVFGSLIVIASNRPEPFALPLWVRPEDCLDVMGRAPITKPDEPGWSHGHRTEAKLKVCGALLALSDLHIELVDVPVPGRRGKTQLLNRKGRVLVVTDAEERRPKEPGDMLANEQRIRITFGAWIDEFGENGLKQFGLISQKAISYSGNFEPEGGLAWYLAFHFGYDRSGAACPLRRKVATLLEASGIVQNERYPNKTRARLEGALERITADGVLGRWKYATDVDAALPAKNWARDWHETTIVLTPPPAIDEGYAPLRGKRGGKSRQLPLVTAT